MLRGITAAQFREWKVYDDLEPFGSQRDDYHSAQIVQALWNIWSISTNPTKGSNRFPIEDFLLRFVDPSQAPPARPQQPAQPVKQTIEYQEMVLDSWIFGHNAALAAGVK